MALTQSAWTVKSMKQKTIVATCTVVATTAENDAYTLKTPKEIDGTKPFNVTLYCSGTPDGSALPIDLWVGTADDFALSGDGASVTATSGFKFKQIYDDCVLAVSPATAVTFSFDPKSAVADVVTVAAIATGLKIKNPPAPYYAFNANGASTLAAVTYTWTIVQVQ